MSGQGAATAPLIPKDPARKGAQFHAMSVGTLVLFPYSMFCIAAILFSFVVYKPWIPWLTVIICLHVCALMFVLHGRNSRGPMYFYLGLLGIAGLALGTVLGLMISSFLTGPVYKVENKVKYTNVLPTDPAAAHDDAGVITFVDAAKVDLSRVMGQKSDDGMTYCVAPILDSTELSRVQYWAVGINCCGATDDFECGDVHSSSVKSGVVWPNEDDGFFLSKDVYSRLLDASTQASSFYSLTNANRPVFLSWVADVDETTDGLWKGAIFAIIVALVLACILSLVVGLCIHYSTADHGK